MDEILQEDHNRVWSLPLTYLGLVQLGRTRIDLMRGFQMSSITCVKLCKFVADEINQVVDAMILVKFVDE
jgi:hypothetical protein